MYCLAQLISFLGLLLLGSLFLGPTAQAGNILVAYCYQKFPCKGERGQIWWDPHNGTEGGIGTCPWLENVLHENIAASAGRCAFDYNVIQPGECKSAPHGVWQRLCPPKK